MNDKKEKRDECKMTQTDSDGNTILDEDGHYENPCYLLVDECCR
jgi:hypothetical protein